MQNLWYTYCMDAIPQRTPAEEWKFRAGLRYHEIAAAIDYSLVHTQLVMTGKRPASDAFMMRFARAYGYDLMRELFERNGQEGNHA